MKKGLCFYVVLIAVIITGGMVFAANGVYTAQEANLTKLYEINLPTNVSDPNVGQIIRENSWDCNGQPVNYKDINFVYMKNVPELTYYNQNTLHISGNNWSGRSSNLDGYLSYDTAKREVQIDFAYQYCMTEYTQQYNYETQQWECVVSTNYTCQDIEYMLSGKILMSIDIIKKVR